MVIRRISSIITIKQQKFLQTDLGILFINGPWFYFNLPNGIHVDLGEQKLENRSVIDKHLIAKRGGIKESFSEDRFFQSYVRACIRNHDNPNKIAERSNAFFEQNGDPQKDLNRGMRTKKRLEKDHSTF